MTTKTASASLIEALALKFSERFQSEYSAPSAEQFYQNMIHDKGKLFWFIFLRSLVVCTVLAIASVYKGIISRIDACIIAPLAIILASAIIFKLTDNVQSIGEIRVRIALRWGRIRAQLMQTVEFRQFADDVKELGLDKAQERYRERWGNLQRILCDLSKVA